MTLDRPRCRVGATATAQVLDVVAEGDRIAASPVAPDGGRMMEVHVDGGSQYDVLGGPREGGHR